MTTVVGDHIVSKSWKNKNVFDNCAYTYLNI